MPPHPDPTGDTTRPSLTAFFPAYNDAPSLPSLVARAFEVLNRHAGDFEVIVVNDGSQDDTASVLAQLQRQHGPRLRVITHERNRGYGGALRTGFAAATKDLVFYTDGDGQYDVGELPALLARLAPDVGLVNGYKTERHDPLHRVWIGTAYNAFARALFRIRLRDIDCDFRLLRRELLQSLDLTSTSGTICVELVRKVELSGCRVEEVPVHHYPRLHGRSQFFRVRSLVATLLQLLHLWASLLLVRSGPPMGARHLAAVALLATVAYLPFLFLPLISDDYTQIRLAREYGPPSGWKALAADPLYRCRATSLLLTYWTDVLFGLTPLAYNLTSLLLHILNAGLVYALGGWRVVGWRVSGIAALCFAILEVPQEAVVWYAALPELLVFTFSLLTLLTWVSWLQSGAGPARLGWYVASLGSFGLALASKESAVAVLALQAVALWTTRKPVRPGVAWLTPFAVLAIGYAGLIFAAKASHLHLNDGTFTFAAPFALTLVRSLLRLAWFWGLLAMAVLAFWGTRVPRPRLQVIGLWAIAALLPYSFLAYMPRVPSRHLYLASVALCLLMGIAWGALQRRFRLHHAWVAAAVALLFVSHNVGYLWGRKLSQYRERAAVTERFLQFARGRSGGVIQIRCMPGNNLHLARDAAHVALDRHPESVVQMVSKSETPVHIYCDPTPDP